MQRTEARWAGPGSPFARPGEFHQICRRAMGSVSLESLLEVLLVLLIAPPVICYALQVLVTLIGFILPWLALVVIVAVIVGALASAAAARQHSPGLPDGHGDDLLPPPPIRRPSGGQRFRD